MGIELKSQNLHLVKHALTENFWELPLEASNYILRSGNHGSVVAQVPCNRHSCFSTETKNPLNPWAPATLGASKCVFTFCTLRIRRWIIPNFETRRNSSTVWCSAMSTLTARWNANSVSCADPVTFAACIACDALRWWWTLRLLKEAQTRLGAGETGTNGPLPGSEGVFLANLWAIH